MRMRRTKNIQAGRSETRYTILPLAMSEGVIGAPKNEQDGDISEANRAVSMFRTSSFFGSGRIRYHSDDSCYKATFFTRYDVGLSPMSSAPLDLGYREEMI